MPELPLRADVAQGRRITATVDRGLNDALRALQADLPLDPMVVACDVDLAARRWLARLAESHGLAMVAPRVAELSDDQIADVVRRGAQELYERGRLHLVGGICTAGPAPDEWLAEGTPTEGIS